MKLLGNSLLALASAVSMGSALADTVDLHSKENTSASWLSIKSMNCAIEPERELLPKQVSRLKSAYQEYAEALQLYGSLIENNVSSEPSNDALMALKSLDKQITKLGGNAYQFVAGHDNIKLLDYYAHSRYGIHDGNVLKTDSGLYDAFNKQPLTVGDIYYRGCLTNNPLQEDPDKLLAIQSDGKINGVTLKDASYLMPEDVHKRYMSVVKEFPDDYITQNMAYIDYAGILDNHSFINIDSEQMRSIATRSIKHLNSDGKSIERVNDLMTLFVFFHELQHVQPDDVHEASGIMYGFLDLPQAKTFKANTLLELRADIFAAARIIQEVKSSDAEPDKIAALIVQAIDDFRIVERTEYHNLHRYFNGIVFENREDVALAKSLDLSDEQRDYLRNIVSTVGKEHGHQKDLAFESVGFSIKYPYQSKIGLDALQQLLNETPVLLKDLSLSSLSRISYDLGSAVAKTTDFRKFLDVSHTVHVEYSQATLTSITSKFSELESNSPQLSLNTSFLKKGM